MSDLLERNGCGVSHHFGGGAYAKEVVIPKGTWLQQHSHPYDHLSILAKGSVTVEAGGVKSWHTGPECMVIKAGIKHSVTALTDAVWFCVHATEDTNPETVDGTILHG